MLAFPIVSLPAQFARAYLRPLSPLGARCQKNNKRAQEDKGRARGGSNPKFAFGALENPEVMRTPPTYQAVGKCHVPAFAIVRLAIRFARGHLRPLSALDGRWPEAQDSANGQGRGWLPAIARYCSRESPALSRLVALYPDWRDDVHNYLR